jgi:hypothetical protein
MVSTSTQYGVYSPQALDPSQVENTLAGQVGASDPAAANMLLNTYQMQRQAAQGNYDYALSQQHDFAKDQLRQQLEEAYLREMPNIAKLPGGARFLAQGGLPGMGALGSNQGALTNLAAAGDQAQAAENAQKGGAGVYSLVEAGRAPDDAQAALATGGVAGPQGTPLSEINALIAAKSRTDAAAMHAKAQQGALAQPMMYPVKGPNGTINAPIDMTKPIQPQVDAIEAWATTLFQNKGQAPQNPAPGVQPAPVSTKRPMGGQSSGVPATPTNLTPNQSSAARLALPPGHSVLPTNTPEGKQAQVDAATALAGVKTSNPALYELIRPRAGPVMDLRKAPDGSIYTIGRDGKSYAIATAKPQQ